MKHERLIIGLLISGIMDDFTVELCNGIMRIAEQEDFDFIVIPGKYLDRDLTGYPEIQYEYQYNTAFAYVNAQNVDGLIIAADCIGCLTVRERMERFLKDYAHIPLVLAASNYEGYVNASFDNYSGVEKGLEELIVNKHCKKFAMMNGSGGSTDAEERKRAFYETLRKHNIPEENITFVPGVVGSSQLVPINEYLDTKPDVDAIFCVNDDTARDLYEAMHQHGLRPGKDIKVFGYDDTDWARRTKPALTSVQADPAVVGEEAARMLLQKLKGENISSKVLSAKLIERASFGGMELYGGVNSKKLLQKKNLPMLFEQIFNKQQNISTKDWERWRTGFITILTILTKALKESRIDAASDEVLEILQRGVDQHILNYLDINNLLDKVTLIYHALEKDAKCEEDRVQLSYLYGKLYRIIIRGLNSQIWEIDNREFYMNYNMKAFARDSVMFEQGNERSYATVLESLHWFDIQNAYLCIFEQPILHLQGEPYEMPETLRLSAALIDGQARPISRVEDAVPADELFSSVYRNKKRADMVLFPIFFNEWLYGILICELNEMIFTMGDFLLNQLNSAVKMIYMLQENDLIQKQLEEHLSVLRANNLELDNLSKSDVLTGIMNRRGFFQSAEQFMEKQFAKGGKVLVSYIDMNNLKIINDSYGHDDGDFSLKSISDLLKEIVGTSGALGRIGGDEFACVISYQEDRVVSFEQEVAERFERFNESTDKPYNVTVSVGTYLLAPDSGVSLENAITLADEKLYEAKLTRSKNVKKEIKTTDK